MQTTGAAHQIAAIYGGSNKGSTGRHGTEGTVPGERDGLMANTDTAFLMSADMGRFRAMGLHEDRSQGWQTYGIMLLFSSIVIYGRLSCSEDELCMINLIRC